MAKILVAEDDSDLRLLYVTVTRAKLELDITGCPFFTGDDSLNVDSLISSIPKLEPKSILPAGPPNRPATTEYTWQKGKNDAWQVRGPKVEIGTTISVKRKDGSESKKTVRKIVAEYPDACVYEV